MIRCGQSAAGSEGRQGRQGEPDPCLATAAPDAGARVVAKESFRAERAVE